MTTTNELRTCGRCTACCTALGIIEIQKQERVPCAHLKRGKPGCGLHGTPGRPTSCTTWRCAWRFGAAVVVAGHGPAHEARCIRGRHPRVAAQRVEVDRTGYILDESFLDVDEQIPVCIIRETAPGSLYQNGRAAAWVRARAEDHLVLVVESHRREFYGPATKKLAAEVFMLATLGEEGYTQHLMGALLPLPSQADVEAMIAARTASHA